MMSATHEVEIELEPLRHRGEHDAEVTDDSWMVPIETFTQHIKSDESLGKLKWKQKRFYKHQNELIQSFLDTHQQVSRLHGETEEEAAAKDKHELAKNIAIYGSVVANICLFILKVIAAYFSGSLSVLASALDSFLDLLSGAIIFLMEFLAKKTSPDDYPAGKSRFEPVGIVIFSACMFTATVQLLLSAIETLITQNLELEISTVTLVVLFTTIGVKFFLWLYCRTVSNSEAVAALSQDHRNDVVTNLFGVATAVLGYYYKWWIDPVGAIVISFYVMSIWARTGYGQLSSLTGKTAPPPLLQALTLVARNHHPSIKAIDTVRAYHYGYNFICELDIVLDPDMPLRIAHDIGESLQNKLEKIEIVERAFVHLDYEFDHKPEHAKSRM